METKRESVNTKKFKVIGHQFIISEKLKNSIENRTYESETGRIIVKKDLIERVKKENPNLLDERFINIHIKDFIIDIYNLRYGMIEVISEEKTNEKENT